MELDSGAAAPKAHALAVPSRTAFEDEDEDEAEEGVGCRLADEALAASRPPEAPRAAERVGGRSSVTEVSPLESESAAEEYGGEAVSASRARPLI